MQKSGCSHCKNEYPLLKDIPSEKNLPVSYCNFLSGLHVFAHILTWCSTFINPIIYFFKNETFKEESIITLRRIEAFFRCKTEDIGQSNANSEFQSSVNNPNQERFIKEPTTDF